MKTSCVGIYVERHDGDFDLAILATPALFEQSDAESLLENFIAYGIDRFCIAIESDVMEDFPVLLKQEEVSKMTVVEPAT